MPRAEAPELGASHARDWNAVADSIHGSTGRLVGYGGGLERKERLLRREGAIVA